MDFIFLTLFINYVLIFRQRSGYDPADCRGADDGYDPFSEDMKVLYPINLTLWSDDINA